MSRYRFLSCLRVARHEAWPARSESASRTSSVDFLSWLLLSGTSQSLRLSDRPG